jgi:predicted short-subunit dehydrogenase-like oxidoreductase (DUF2520 family)
MIQSVVIIGSGNLAESLAQAVADSSVELRQLFGRNVARVAEVARLARTVPCCDATKLAVADLYILAVSDRAVAEVASQLPIPAKALVAHTAGSVDILALASYARRAVLYPLQTFTKGRRVDFAQVPLLIESSTDEAAIELEAFARQLSQRIYRVDSEQRGKVHLAGVLACNFANHLFELGCEVLQQAQLPTDLLHTLIAETTAKALSAARPADVQTGPAVRNDVQTQERHLRLLSGDKLHSEIYRLLTQSIWETSKKIS